MDFFSQYGWYLFLALGGFCIAKGIKILITKKLSDREEAALKTFPEKGRQRYRILSAVMNIMSGVLCITVTLSLSMNLIAPELIRIFALTAVVVMVVAFILVRESCRKAK